MAEQELTTWGEMFKAELARTEAVLRGFEQALVDAGLLTQGEADTWPS